MADEYHRPVLFDEVMDALALFEGGVWVDATVGGGGHSRGIADRIGPTGTVIGIDRDPQALAEAERTLSGASAQFLTFRAPFDHLSDALTTLGLTQVDGILYDLGVSSKQLDDPGRGFTFRDINAPLDMRMSQLEDGPTAAELLNNSSAEELTVMFRDNADEKWAARIAQFVVERRDVTPFSVAGQLIETVKAAIPVGARSKDIHPATKTFQALRIAVNDEFARLRSTLWTAVNRLKSDGRIVVISYHSGEDRIVKQVFSEMAGKCICPPEAPICVCQARQPLIALMTRKPVIPTAQEVSVNPRARSAKLRIARRL